MYRRFKTKKLGINISVNVAGKSKIKLIKIFDWHYIAMEGLCNNQKERTTFFFIIKAVNFFNERPCVCSFGSFLVVISTSAKIVDLHDTAS